MLTKTCRKCGLAKSREDFSPNGICKSGAIKLRSRCKPCQASVVSARVHAMTPEANAARLARRRENEYPRTENERARRRAYWSAWRRRPSVLPRQRALESANAKRWAQRNPEKRAAIETLSRRSHGERVRVLSGVVTASEWSAIKVYFGKCCAYCGQRTKLSQDHVLAISKGGAHVADNIIPACRSCNSKKGARGILSMVNVEYTVQ